jgi:hypothetical protein
MMPFTDMLDPIRTNWRTEMLLPKFMKSITDNADPSLANERTDSELFRCMHPWTDVPGVKLTCEPCTEIADPMRARYRTDMDEPKLRKSNMLTPLPKRPIERKLIEEPSDEKLSTEIEEPRRAVLLMLSAEPRCIKSTTDTLNALPNLVTPCTDIEDPQRIAARRLTEDPSARKSTTEMFLPSRAKERIESELEK